MVYEARPNSKKATIRIVEHFSNENSSKRKALGPLVKTCRDAQKKVTLVRDQLLVEGKLYSLRDIHKLEAQGIDPQALACKRNCDRILYYGNLSILSNFHISPFYLDNVLWNCNEQYFQYNKAIKASHKGIISS